MAERIKAATEELHPLVFQMVVAHEFEAMDIREITGENLLFIR